MYYAEGPLSAQLMANPQSKGEIYCELISTTFDQYESCLGGFKPGFTLGYILAFATKYLIPPWEYIQ